MLDKQLPSYFYYKKSRLQQLKGFCFTVQEGSVTKAAEKMGLTTPTVTMQIKSLEDDLNTKLFDRVKNRLKLNERGEMFYKMAIPLVQSADGLFEKFLYESKKIKESQIKIGAYHVVLSHLLPDGMRDFLTKFPDSKFILRNIPRAIAYRDIIDDKLDLVIYPIERGEKIPEELECVHKFRYDLVLIVSKKHPLAKKSAKKITKEDIANNNFIYHLNKKMITAGSWLNFATNYDITANVDIEDGNWETVKALVSRNIGVGVMSKTYIDKNDKEIIAKSVTHLFPDFFFYVIVKKNGFMTDATRHFLKLLCSR